MEYSINNAEAVVALLSWGDPYTVAITTRYDSFLQIVRTQQIRQLQHLSCYLFKRCTLLLRKDSVLICIIEAC